MIGSDRWRIKSSSISTFALARGASKAMASVHPDPNEELADSSALSPSSHTTIG
jgi:3-deoxy-D-arabino-heptulosonate 7-phosphate (DAHP) synthase